MSLSDAWLGEGDAAAGEAQEEVHQALTCTAKSCKGQEDSGKSMECQLLWRVKKTALALTLFRLAR